LNPITKQTSYSLKAKYKPFPEKYSGWLMILPALLVILAIAVWPVVQSFFYSTFDLRLNDPTKRKATLSYEINMETYRSNIQSLFKTFDSEVSKVKDPSVSDQLRGREEKIKANHDLLIKDAGFKNSFDKVQELQMDFQPVPANMQYFKLSKATAAQISSDFKTVQEQLDKLGKENKLNKPKDILGSMNIVIGAVIAPNFVGFANYKYFLSDARMWHSLTNTIRFTAITVTVEFVIGVMIALLINKNFKGRGLVRAAILVPWAIPTTVSAKMWLYLFNGEYGIVSKFFETIGLIPHMGDMLTSPFWQNFAVIFADVWKTTPFVALLILAGLQTIPDSLYEAAKVDGANKIQQFFKITLPLLKTTIMVALMFRTLAAFRVFDLIYVMLGRTENTEVISTYAYQTMFAQTEFGRGSTLSVIVFLCIALISIIFIRLLGSELLERR
jgi:multiple sugar transport system permease protein